jgi:hypothetical protein
MYRVIAAILCIAAIFGAQRTITMPFGRASQIHGQIRSLNTRPLEIAPKKEVKDFKAGYSSRAFLVADQH